MRALLPLVPGVLALVTAILNRRRDHSPKRESHGVVALRWAVTAALVVATVWLVVQVLVMAS